MDILTEKIAIHIQYSVFYLYFISAVSRGHLPIVTYLLENKANASFTTTHQHNSVTTILMTPPNKKLEILKLLIQYGANVDFEDSYGKNILHNAVEKGWVEVMK